MAVSWRNEMSAFSNLTLMSKEIINPLFKFFAMLIFRSRRIESAREGIRPLLLLLAPSLSLFKNFKRQAADKALPFPAGPHLGIGHLPHV